jgi:hypothetical protein
MRKLEMTSDTEEESGSETEEDSGPEVEIVKIVRTPAPTKPKPIPESETDEDSGPEIEIVKITRTPSKLEATTVTPVKPKIH